MILPIAYYNDPILRKAGEAVGNFDADLQRLSADMIETMHHAEGIGLAAQQIGKALRFCVIDLRGAGAPFDFQWDGRSGLPLDLIMPLSMANPQVSVPAAESVVYEEGCLSFPEIRGNVERPDRIRVRFQDLQGAWHTVECDGLFARCVLHEVDHLEGVLFIDRMEKKDVKALEKQLKALKRETRDALRTT